MSETAKPKRRKLTAFEVARGAHYFSFLALCVSCVALGIAILSLYRSTESYDHAARALDRTEATIVPWRYQGRQWHSIPDSGEEEICPSCVFIEQ